MRCLLEHEGVYSRFCFQSFEDGSMVAMADCMLV